MARDANQIAEARGLPLSFQALVPRKLVAETPLGRTVAGDYARRRGISIEALVAERYGTSMTVRDFGEAVARWLTGPRANGIAFGVGAVGVEALAAPSLSG